MKAGSNISRTIKSYLVLISITWRRKGRSYVVHVAQLLLTATLYICLPTKVIKSIVLVGRLHVQYMLTREPQQGQYKDDTFTFNKCLYHEASTGKKKKEAEFNFVSFEDCYLNPNEQEGEEYPDRKLPPSLSP